MKQDSKLCIITKNKLSRHFQWTNETAFERGALIHHVSENTSELISGSVNSIGKNRAGIFIRTDTLFKGTRNFEFSMEKLAQLTY